MSLKKTKQVASKPTAQNFVIPPVVLWVVWGIYAALVLYTTAQHEPWRDEAQSWLIARENSLFSLFQYLPNEGHPPLWYLILMPFAKLGFPYATANIIHNLIIIAFAWIVLFRLRLAIWFSLPLLFSYYFVYEYAVIARNYSIVALLLALAAMMYEKRFEQPLLFALIIFLLFQTNVLAFCTGAGLGAIFLWDVVAGKRFQPKNFLALALMAAGALAMIVLLLSAGMKSSYSKESNDKLYTLYTTFGNALFLNTENGLPAVLIYAAVVISFFRKPKVMAFLLIATAGYIYLSLYQFQGTTRHHGFLLIFLFGGFALAGYESALKRFENLRWLETSTKGVFAFLMLLLVFKSFNYITDEWNRNFSDAKNVAEFINKNGLDKYTIVGHRSYAVSAVVPYLPKGKEIWYADQKRYGSFVYLDTVFFNNYLSYNGDYAPFMVQENFKPTDSVLLLMSVPIQYPDFLKIWKPVYQSQTEPIKRDEAFIVYMRNI